MPSPIEAPNFVIGSAPPSPVLIAAERRRSSEEYAARMQLHAFSEINQMLAKRNLQIEAELRAKAEAAKSKAPARPVFKHVLSEPSGTVYPMGLRPTGRSALDSMEEIPLTGLARRRSTPGILPMPEISPTSTPRARSQRHYFDLTPGGGQRPSTPRGDYFTPMEAPATVVEEEPETFASRAAPYIFGLGMAAMATPIVLFVVKGIQKAVDAATSKGNQ